MNTMFRLVAPVAIVATSLLGACQSKERSDTGASAETSTPSAAAAGSLEGPRQADTTQSTGGMQGMSGMKGGQMAGMMGMGMMDSMQTHMRMMEGVSADQMKGMLPAHRQMVANMLSQLDRDMQKMNMKPDAKWTALTDSVRQDLVRMPEMGGSELRTFMPEHHARVMRLMEMHRSMMGGMKM